jgi:hypothetical protein
MRNKPRDINEEIGERYGRLLVLSVSDQRLGNQVAVICKCDCGNICTKRICSIRSLFTRSCGCLHRESTKITRRIHGKSGKSGDPLYKIWLSMKQRCSNPKNKNYSSYGGRGITVCEEWKTDFNQFYADMSPSYKKGLSLDRKENNDGYYKTNCRWVTPSEQAKNQRRSITIEFNGNPINLKTLCQQENFDYGRMRYRIVDMKLNIEEAIKMEKSKTWKRTINL